MLRANYENHKAKQRHSISSARDQVRPVRCSGGSCSQGDGQRALNSQRLWSACISAPVSSTHLIPMVSNLSLCLHSVFSLPWNNSLCLLMVNTCYGCPSYKPVVPHIEQVTPLNTVFNIANSPWRGGWGGSKHFPHWTESYLGSHFT